MSASPSRAIAQSPFDDVTASIVLRSCDNVDFYVYREILKAASPFFRTMFSLPQPTPIPGQSNDLMSSSEDEVSPEGLLILFIPEDSDTMDYILRLCYPLRAPARLTSLSLAEKVLTVALKYEINKVIDLVKDEVVLLGKSSPVRLYMFSCRHGLEEGARIAAGLLRESREVYQTEKSFIRIAMDIYSDEYGQLPAIFLYRLLRHVWSGDQQSFCNDSPSASNAEASLENNDNQSKGCHELPLDLAGFLSKHPADILLLSSDGIVVPTHKVILRISSGDTLLTQSEAEECPKRDDLPLVSVTTAGAALVQLIRACYFPPNCHEDIHKPEDDLRLVYAAEGCGMHRIATMARERWLSHIQKDPLNSYFVACLNGWTTDACEVLRHMATEGVPASTNNIPIMSLPGTAKHYYTFLQYYNALYQAEEMATETVHFTPNSEETWNDPFFAFGANIAPAVAFRALQLAAHAGQKYGYTRHVRIVDPPTADDDDAESSGDVRGKTFRQKPAQYIRAMVHDTQLLQEKRRSCINRVRRLTVVRFSLAPDLLNDRDNSPD